MGDAAEDKGIRVNDLGEVPGEIGCVRKYLGDAPGEKGYLLNDVCVAFGEEGTFCNEAYDRL